MSILQKCMRIDGMVLNHAKQRCPVALPIGNPQARGLLIVKSKMPGNPGCHFVIHSWHDVGACIMQGVVKVKQPDRTSTSFEPRDRLSLKGCQDAYRLLQ